MRVLVAHNYYQSANPSGENRAVDVITESLAAHGADVDVVAWHSDGLAASSRTDRLRIAAGMLYSTGRSAFVATVRRLRPDVVQVHNPLPRLPPGDLAELRRHGVAVVQVAHNYRHSCLSGSHRLGGDDCHACAPTRWSRLPGVRNRCYRGSLSQSVLLTISETAYHQMWRTLDGYVAISEHIRRYLVAQGCPPERIATISNPVPAVPRVHRTARDVLFAGRLVPEKGVAQLLAAWAALGEDGRDGRVLHIAGAGPEETAVAAAVAGGDGVEFHGRLGIAELAELGSRCAVSVVPSVWDEPFGLTAAEALAAGRGVVASARGALPEIATDPACSWLGEPDCEGLTAALRRALAADRRQVADAAVRLWRERFSPEVVGRAHLDYLADVVDRTQTARKGTVERRG